MAGNSRRVGATRRPGTKKGPQAGTGGNGRQALEGRGPTPKAVERPNHPAARRAAAANRSAGPQASGSGQRRSSVPTAAARKKAETEIVSGRNAVLEALRAGVPISQCWVAQRLESDDRTKEILQLVTFAGRPLLEITRNELDRITDGSVNQGVAIAVPPYEYSEPDDLLDAAALTESPALIIALDGVTDPRNLGAVLRSAGAFGANGVVVPTRRSAGVTASAWKVSAGAAARVPVARATNLVRALEDYRKAGCFVVGLDGGGDVPIHDLPFSTDPLVVVIGSEGKGLSRLVRATCDAIASIPIASAVESLNAGVAAGIALYEIAGQRQRQL